MDGWRVRHDLSGDVPFFAGVLIFVGGLIGAAIGIGIDVLIHHHRGRLR